MQTQIQIILNSHFSQIFLYGLVFSATTCDNWSDPKLLTDAIWT